MTVQPELKSRRRSDPKFCFMVKELTTRAICITTHLNRTASGTRVFATSKFRTTTSDYNTAVSGWRLSDIHVTFTWQSHKSLSEHYIECVVIIMYFWRDFISLWPHTNIDTTQRDCKLPTLWRTGRHYDVLWFLNVAPVSMYTHKL